MKKTLKILGIIFSILLIYSIIFSTIVDRTIPLWSDAGVLEIFFYLVVGTVSGIDVFVTALIVFSILIFLQKRKKIVIGDGVLLFVGYLITALLNLSFSTYFISKFDLTFDLERFTFVFILPIIHSIIVFYLIKFISHKFSKKKWKKYYVISVNI